MSHNWQDLADEGIEEYLEGLIAEADESGRVRTSSRKPEFAWLEKRGAFDSCRKYLDGTALVSLSYEALRYFDARKGEESDGGSGGGIANKVAGVAGSFVGAAMKEIIE